jgi:ABC-2 type transport system ATP-binding protein
MEAPPILQFENVSKWYGPVIGLNHVSLELRSGITGLVGSNGAGKSTLIRLATGQLKPSLGVVRVRGVDAWDWRAKTLVGYCPDNDAFYEDMSGREFVRAMARLNGYDRAEAVRRSEALIDRVGMADRADRRLRGYSKGMRQRVKLAQALLTDPELLVLDEPLSGIDPVGRQEMLELFCGLAAEGKCLLVSSHELEELEKLTDRVVIMARGRVAAHGTVAEIRQMLDDQPLSVRIDVADPKGLASLLIHRTDVVGIDLDSGGTSLVVRARHPKQFFDDFGRIVLEQSIAVERLEPLDESTHAILGYILGGSGKT